MNSKSSDLSLLQFITQLASAKLYCGVMKLADMPPCLGGGENGINQWL